MRDVLVKTELEQATMAREEEMGMWKRRAEEAEKQIWNLTKELVALREENDQIREELDLRKAEVCTWYITYLCCFASDHLALMKTALAIDGFQMSIKRPTSRGQACAQKAAV